MRCIRCIPFSDICCDILLNFQLPENFTKQIGIRIQIQEDVAVPVQCSIVLIITRACITKIMHSILPYFNLSIKVRIMKTKTKNHTIQFSSLIAFEIQRHARIIIEWNYKLLYNNNVHWLNIQETGFLIYGLVNPAGLDSSKFIIKL